MQASQSRDLINFWVPQKRPGTPQHMLLTTTAASFGPDGVRLRRRMGPDLKLIAILKISFWQIIS